MKIDTKFAPNQKVYFFYGNKVDYGIIVGVHVFVERDNNYIAFHNISYNIPNISNCLSEKLMFISKEELIKSL